MTFLPRLRGMNMAALQVGGAPPAGWSIVGTTESVVPTGAGNTTVNLPGTPAEDDVAVLILGSDQAITGNKIASAGWGATVVSTSLGLQVYTKQLGASPDASVDVVQEAARAIACIIRVYRGAAVGTYLDATPTDATGNGTTPDPPAIVTVTNGCKIVAIGFIDDVVITAVTEPSGYENLDWLPTGEVMNSSGTVMIADLTQATLGSTNPGSFSVTGGSDDWVSCTIALRPA
jgi:hypothetical protein